MEKMLICADFLKIVTTMTTDTVYYNTAQMCVYNSVKIRQGIWWRFNGLLRKSTPQSTNNFDWPDSIKVDRHKPDCL